MACTPEDLKSLDPNWCRHALSGFQERRNLVLADVNVQEITFQYIAVSGTDS